MEEDDLCGDAEMQVQFTLNYRGVDILCTADLATANKCLNDQAESDKFVETHLDLGNPMRNRGAEEETSDTDQQSTFEEPNTAQEVWIAKNPTQRDQAASEFFLRRRAHYATQFDDNKHTKSILWQKIVQDMNAKGYYVGLGKVAAEKCRQKFANIQRSYMQYMSFVKKTGEGKKKPPPFFDLVHDILGHKDKVIPPFTTDSEGAAGAHSQEVCENSSTGEVLLEEAETSSESGKIKTRFAKSTKRTLRPESNTTKLLTVLENCHQEDLQQRDNHMQRLEQMFEAQHSQRERFLNILEKKNKRKRQSSSSDSD